MTRVLIVGVDSPGHVGRFLTEGAVSKRIEAEIIDTSLAMGKDRYVQSIAWRLNHYPLRMKVFERMIEAKVEEFMPDAVISTGLAPIRKKVICRITERGIPVVNYSTDDPWNPAHRSRWFLNAIPTYTTIFTTRRSAISDLERVGAKKVEWLPFAIDPINHFPEPSEKQQRQCPSVTLIGGADKDRLTVIEPIIKARISLELWGGYWERYKLTKPYWRGMAKPVEVRRLLSDTCCALTLVRRANRDGHAMRTYEVAAMGSPALAERTEEHLEILGQEGTNALYFDNPSELVSKATWMINNPIESREMGKRLHQRVAEKANTYADRLITILQKL